MNITNSFFWSIVALVIILVGFWAISFFTKRWYRSRIKSKGTEGVVFVFKVPSPLLTWLKELRIVPTLNQINIPVFSLRAPVRLKITCSQLLEVAIIIIWALWVGRGYLDFDAHSFIPGGDFPTELPGLYMWHLLPQCGACFMWNGYLDGGAPAFADLVGSAMHPLVAIATLVWGVINGVKFTLIVSLIIAGLAQWWLARVMGLGWLARLWSGLMIVVCGFLGGNLSGGVYNLVLSSANACLILPPLVDLALNHNRRSIAWMGIALALTFLSGGGYIQVGVVFVILPALLAFVLFNERASILVKDFGLAWVLGLMLAAYLIIPVAHFYTVFTPAGGIHEDTMQSLSTVILNFVSTDALKVNYIIFVGWVPLILAFFALRLAPREKSRLLWFFIVGIFLALAFSTSELILFLGSHFPDIGVLRFPPPISSLAVPFLMGLAAWGVDLIVRAGWPKITFIFSNSQAFLFSKSWLVLAIPLIYAIVIAYPLARAWMYTDKGVDQPKEIIQAIQTDSSQWVRFPTRDFRWAPVLLELGNYKLTAVYHPWEWRGREMPLPSIEAAYTADIGPSQQQGVLQKVFEYYNIYTYPTNPYAAIKTDSGMTPCRANSLGGNIDVTCDAKTAGQLVVQEYSWSGWYGWVDGKTARLASGQWLSVAAPAGKHTFTFRYQPWDVPLGLFVTLCGIVLVVWLCLPRKVKPPAVAVENDETA